MALVLRSPLDLDGQQAHNLGDGTAPTDVVNLRQLQAGDAAAAARSNHTGTQLASTISDLAAVVQGTRLDQLAAPQGPLSVGGQRVGPMADGVSSTDGVTVGQLNAAISTAVTGLAFKGAVKSAVGAQVSVASPGAALDGVTYVAGDVVLLYGQPDASQNGPWTWAGPTAAMTRPANFDTSAEAALGSFWVVEQSGTTYKKGDSFAIMANDAAVVLGTTSLSFIFISALGAMVTGVAVSTTAGATVTLTHGLGTRDVIVQVYRNTSPWDTPLVETNRPTVDTVSVVFDAAQAAGDYRVLVSKCPVA